MTMLTLLLNVYLNIIKINNINLKTTTMKSLINQLIEAKRTNNEDAYEEIHEEMSNELETLCNSFTENEVNKESITELADFIEQYSKSLREYAADL